MKIYETNQKYFAIIGISAEQSIQRHPFLNVRSVICALIFLLTFISNIAYILLLANDFESRTDMVFTLFTFIAVVILFGCNIWHMRQLFEAIKNTENIIQKSKRIRNLSSERMISFILILYYCRN